MVHAKLAEKSQNSQRIANEFFSFVVFAKKLCGFCMKYVFILDSLILKYKTLNKIKNPIQLIKTE